VKLNEALQAAAAARELPVRERLFLVCGFEPLHLLTFLRAHYARQNPGLALDVSAGLYGDVEGNLARAGASQATVAAVLLEWADLDSRLGVRATGSWSFARQAEIVADIRQRLGRLEAGIRRLAERMPVVIARPTLAFSLLGHTHGWQLGGFELELEQALLAFLGSLSKEPRVRLLHPERLASESPVGVRRDPRSELSTGFPYRIEHASVVGRAVVELAHPAPPMKGLITDLDDTLWAGLVGEVGVGAVAWSLEDRAQIHGLYQSVLGQLHDAGVLLAVASKNEPDVVARALAREDLRLDASALFPVEVSWGPKSAAVDRILSAWNISADAVVVVDDSRMELEEIRRVHPQVTCLEFTPNDPQQALLLLERLRDLFGKPAVTAEDRLRGASLRQRVVFEEQRSVPDLVSFLGGLAGTVTFDDRKNPDDPRLLSLINKTNQFNLNGRRISEGEWLRFLGDESSFVLGASYADRFGALGTIGVAAGSIGPDGIDVEHWVLSCRAFSRRIEDHMLDYLLEHAGVGGVRLRYEKTEKNNPFSEFLERLGVGAPTGGVVTARRAAIGQALEGLPHQTARAPARAVG
jgi:FkbH-like protein